MGQEKYQRDGDPRTSGPGFGVTMHEDGLEEPLRWRTPRKVFVNSMSDISGGVTILNRASPQVIGHEVGLERVRQVSRTGGAGR
jgi:hypothetical protein